MGPVLSTPHSATIAAALSFLIGRTLLRSVVERWMDKVRGVGQGGRDSGGLLVDRFRTITRSNKRTAAYSTPSSSCWTRPSRTRASRSSSSSAFRPSSPSRSPTTCACVQRGTKEPLAFHPAHDMDARRAVMLACTPPSYQAKADGLAFFLHVCGWVGDAWHGGMAGTG